MIYIIIALLIVIFSIIYCINCNKKRLEHNTEIIKETELLEKDYNRKYEELIKLQDSFQIWEKRINDIILDAGKVEEQLKDEQKEYQKIVNENNKNKIILENLLKMEQDARDRLKDNDEIEKQHLEEQKALVSEAFKNWCESLDLDYQKVTQEYKDMRWSLEAAFDERHSNLLAEAAKEAEELAQIRATRASAIEALRREKEILEDSTFYCLQVSDEDKADIGRLNSIKKTLNKPRVLSMLVWQAYFQKKLKTLSAQILGNRTVTGIYKITNIITGEVYIGQSVDIAARWVQHAKHGLGIDTPAGNKLYKNMQEYGLYSFSWELMEECTPAELNAKERFYIELYDSVNFGLNGTKGNN